ncbi:MAG: YeeE/YedE family protein [Nevskia sp.]|nr:YeeE/YedE family protein [Nevskia sp.]
MNVLIDVDSWLRAAAGGLLIGLAAAVMIVFNGRIAGVSGVLGGLMFDGNGSDRRWRSMFLGGMVLGAVLLTTLVTSLPAGRLQTGWLGMAIAGLIVGYGTRMGSGCTSGHGVCGIARLSTRSITATITFMAFGALTVFVIRHLLGAAS